MNRSLYLYRWVMWNIFSHTFINVHLKPTYNFHKTPESDPFPPPPFIVIANHGTFFDPWLIGKFTHRPFGLMTNDDGFRGKGVSQWYLRSIGAFPKKKGASDYKAMKTTIDLLKSNYPVCIFPEGQTTWDGETQLIYRGIEKIIKKFNVPLVTVRFQGDFLTKPWWAHTKRKGRIDVNIKVVDAKAIETLTSEQIFDKIKSSIHQNDIKDPKNLAYPFKGKLLAKGLERFVWICMHCGKEDMLSTEGDFITCASCGSKWQLNAHCQISAVTPGAKSLKDLKDWADMHKARVLENISDIDNLSTSTPAVELQCENELNEFVPIDNAGNLEIIKRDLYYKSSQAQMKWPIDELEDYVIQKKDIFEFKHKDKQYRIVFNGKSPMKWIYYVRYMRGFTECENRGYM